MRPSPEYRFLQNTCHSYCVITIRYTIVRVYRDILYDLRINNGSLNQRFRVLKFSWCIPYTRFSILFHICIMCIALFLSYRIYMRIHYTQYSSFVFRITTKLFLTIIYRSCCDKLLKSGSGIPISLSAYALERRRRLYIILVLTYFVIQIILFGGPLENYT